MIESNRKRLALLAFSYSLAVGGGVWLAAPACDDPLWVHYAFFGTLLISFVAVVVYPATSRARVLWRLPAATGLFATVVGVRILMTPFFPGIDWHGRPSSIDSYALSVYGIAHAAMHFDSAFGACSGLPKPGRR